MIVREGHDGEQGRHVVEGVYINIAISISIRAAGAPGWFPTPEQSHWLVGLAFLVVTTVMR